MVAARNIKAGEVVLKEAPLTYGPNEITKPICLGCCAPVTIKSPTCDICGFPMCSKECSNSKIHKEFECEALKKHGYKVDASTFNFGDVELTYAIISPIRTFMLKEKYPDLWNLAWMQMSHLAKRKELNFWNKETEKILNLLQTMIGLKVLGYIVSIQIYHLNPKPLGFGRCFFWRNDSGSLNFLSNDTHCISYKS